MQLVAPEAEYLPAEQSVQLVAPEAEYLPAEQSVQSDAPEAEYLPAEHSTHPNKQKTQQTLKPDFTTVRSEVQVIELPLEIVQLVNELIVPE